VMGEEGRHPVSEDLNGQAGKRWLMELRIDPVALSTCPQHAPHGCDHKDRCHEQRDNAWFTSTVFAVNPLWDRDDTVVHRLDPYRCQVVLAGLNGSNGR
jgi:hypothetical protein